MAQLRYTILKKVFHDNGQSGFEFSLKVRGRGEYHWFVPADPSATDDELIAQTVKFWGLEEQPSQPTA